jgi:hypothetical protein
MRKCTILLAVALVAMLVAGNAFATLIIDVKAVDATGGAVIASGGKTVDVTNAAVGSIITFDVWANFTTGTTATNTITQIQGGMASVRDAANYAVKGNISPITQSASPIDWGMAGSQDGVAVANAMNDLILPVTPSASVWGAKNSLAQAIDFAAGTKLGTFTYTVTGARAGEGLKTTVNFTPFTSTTVPAGTWKEAGVSYSSLTTPKPYQVYAAGAPVELVAIPEPTTFVLLGMGALALVFVRRRK